MPSVLVNGRHRLDHRQVNKHRAARLANRLRVERAERDMSQDELARAVGVSRNTVGSIETGRYTPSALLAFRLAEALGVAITELFWIEGEAR
jgi:putative transcriptional regulator